MDQSIAGSSRSRQEHDFDTPSKNKFSGQGKQVKKML
jgi:hypothetical protein